MKKHKLNRSITLAAGIAPIALLTSIACTSADQINEGQKAEAIIQKNITTRVEQTVRRTYSVFQGNKEHEFNNLASAYNFLETTSINSDAFYKIDNDYQGHAGTTEVEIDNFVPDSSSQLVVSYKKADGTFNFAPRNDSVAQQKARLEAALTYIQVHNGYQYQGYFFDNFNDVESFVRTLPEQDIANIIAGRQTDRKMVRFGDGTVKSFANFDEIKHAIANTAIPYYKDSFGNLVPINQTNFQKIANSFDEDDLMFIPISSNDGKGTQIVDMDASTPNGQIYGPYLFQSGIGIDGVYDPLNWKPLAANSQVTSYQETYQEQILNAYVSNLILKQGVMFDDFVKLQKIRFGESDITLMQYLETISSSFNYASALDQFFSQIRQGTRYTALNSIILARAFLMDKMVQNKERTDKIVYLSKFFHAMAVELDNLNTAELAPFLIKGTQKKSIRISYFADTFAFDSDTDYNNYAFQTDPGFYYRRLLGLDDQFKVASLQNNEAIFKLIHASFGPLLMMNDEVEKIKDAYAERVKTLENNLENDGRSAPDKAKHDKFSLVFNHLASSTIFKGEAGSGTSGREYDLIWSILNDAGLKGAFQYKVFDEATNTWINQAATGSIVRSNYSDFLYRTQNKILSLFVSEIYLKALSVNKKVEAGNYSSYNEIWNTDEGKEVRNLNIASFMAQSINLVVENLPQTLKERQDALQDSINHLLPSEGEKWTGFAYNFLLPMFNVATSIVITAQIAIPFVQNRLKKAGEKNPDNQNSNDLDIDTHNAKAKKTYKKLVNDDFKESDVQNFKQVGVGSDFDAIDEKLIAYPILPKDASAASRSKVLLAGEQFTIDEIKLFSEGKFKRDWNIQKIYNDATPDEKLLINKQFAGMGDYFDEKMKTTLFTDFNQFADDLATKMKSGKVILKDQSGRIINGVEAYYGELDKAAIGIISTIGNKVVSPNAQVPQIIYGDAKFKSYFRDLHKKAFEYSYQGPANLNVANQIKPKTVLTSKPAALNDNLTGPSSLVKADIDDIYAIPIKKAKRKQVAANNGDDIQLNGEVEMRIKSGRESILDDNNQTVYSPDWRADPTIGRQLSLFKINLDDGKGLVRSHSFTFDILRNDLRPKELKSVRRTKSLRNDVRIMNTTNGGHVSPDVPSRNYRRSEVFSRSELTLMPSVVDNFTSSSNKNEAMEFSQAVYFAPLATELARGNADSDGSNLPSKPIISDGVKKNAQNASAALMAFQGFVGASVGLSALIGIAAAITQMVATYETIQVIPYEFKTREGISLYWDGTRVTSKMWGLSNNIEYNIRDLKVVTTNVISGYTANEQGIYHNGKFYKDTNEVRKTQADDLVKALKQINRLDESMWGIKLKNVVWKSNLEGFDDDLEYDSIDDLINAVKGSQSTISAGFDKVYQVLDNKVTSSINSTIEDVIRSLGRNLKKALIFKLPESDNDGELIKGRFQLPEPYYSNGRKYDAPSSTDHVAYQSWQQRAAKYIVYDQSVSREWLDMEANKNAAERDKLYNYFDKIFKSSIGDAFNKIITEHASKIIVPEKVTTFNQVLKTKTFDELKSVQEQNKVRVHYFVDKNGKVRYFTSQSDALQALQASERVTIFQNDNLHEEVKYIYENQEFNSLEEIYTAQKIVKNSR